MRRLSYADRRLYIIAFVVGLAVASLIGLVVSRDALFYARALGDRYVSDEIYYVDVARRLLLNVFHVTPRHLHAWSGQTNPDYYNPEHPPLGKYLIALSMIACGDRPLCWRLPGAIEAGLIPLALYLGYALRRRSIAGVAAGMAAALAAASSAAIRYEGAVAMLDIHQAFFEALAIAALASERPLLASVFTGLAASTKYSGFFMVPAIWGYIAARTESRRERLKAFIYSLVVPPLVVVLVSAPIIYHFGVTWFWENSVTGALAWHTTSRPQGPPVSSPGGWLVNANPFYFDYDTMIGGIANTALHITGLALGGAAIIYIYWRSSWPAAGSLAYYSILGMYLLLSHLYLLHIPGLHGNRTLYSFYVVQLSPAAAAVYADVTAIAGEGLEGGSNPTRD